MTRQRTVKRKSLARCGGSSSQGAVQIPLWTGMVSKEVFVT